MRNYSLTFLSVVVLLVTACGKGGTSNTQTASTLCEGEKLFTTAGACVTAKAIDVDGNGEADGLDLNNDKVPDILFGAKGSSPAGVTPIDINADGTNDYFLVEKNGVIGIYDNDTGTGNNAYIVVDSANRFLGIDNDRNGVVDEASEAIAEVLADETAPVVSTNITGGIFGAPQQVILNCADDVACGAIAFNIDQIDNPTFILNTGSTIVLGGAATLQLGQATTGDYVLKYVARDIKGNVGEVKTLTITIDATKPTITLNKESGVYQDALVVKATCADNIGCASIAYSFGNEDPDFDNTNQSAEGEELELDFASIGGGGFVLQFQGKDSQGNLSEIVSGNYTLDLSAPVLSIVQAARAFNENKSIEIRCNDDLRCTDIAYTTNGDEVTFPEFNASNDVKSVLIELGNVSKQITLKVQARDSAQRTSELLEEQFLLDFDAPVTTSSVASGTFADVVDVVLSCADSQTQCNTVAYSVSSNIQGFETVSSSVPGGTANLQIGKEGPGTYVLKFFGSDSIGNVEQEKTLSFEIDNEKPVTTVDLDKPYYKDAQLTAKISCTDNNACEKIAYVLNFNDSNIADPSFTDGNSIVKEGATTDVFLNKGQGTYYLKYRGLDSVGNVGAIGSLITTIDNDLPSTNATPAPVDARGGSTISMMCQDTYECDKIVYTIDGTPPSFDPAHGIVVEGPEAKFQLPQGNSNTKLSFLSMDKAGNIEASASSLDYNVVCASLPIIADAGADQFVSHNLSNSANNKFSLDGSGSSANIGGLSYQWHQIVKGNEPIYNSQSGISFSDVIPERVTTLQFELTVTADHDGCQASDTVNIYVMEDPTKAVFVDGDNGHDTNNDGTRNSPLKTIQKAIAVGGEKDVYIVTRGSKQPYDTTTGELLLPNGVSLYGGFDSNWMRNTKENKTLILTADRALKADGLSKSLWIEGFQLIGIKSQIWRTDGIYAYNVSASVTIRDNIITLADAGPPTYSYGNVSTAVTLYNVDHVLLANNEITAGNAGYAKNGADGAYQSKATKGGNGTAGGTNASVTNGGRGNGTSPWGDGGKGGFLITKPSSGVGDATNGCATGGSSKDGNPGDIGESSKYVAIRGEGLGNPSQHGLIFSNSSGEDGKDGTSGCNGGGGAGGTAGYKSIPLTYYQGGGGGGGGAGGSAGKGGKGGWGGGASIGVFARDVNFLEIKNNYIQSLNGGNGGNGGLGSEGGLGGDGGKGYVSSVAGSGFNGGAGGKGGSGSNGAGGGGGPSIGVYLGTGIINLSIMDNLIGAGNGGLGGNSNTPESVGIGGYSVGVFDFYQKLDASSGLNTNSIWIGNGGAPGGVASGVYP